MMTEPQPVEIEKIQKDEGKEEEKFIDVVINKNMKLGQKVLIPVKQFPKPHPTPQGPFSSSSGLLAPRAWCMTGISRWERNGKDDVKVVVVGVFKGNWDAKPVVSFEEELRQSGEAKYHHLNEDLHVLIEVFAPPAEAYARMGHALEEIKKFLIPLLFGLGQLILILSTVKPESRRGSSPSCGGAPRSSTQRSPTQPGSILQREGGAESQRRPTGCRIPTSSSHSSGHTKDTRPYLWEYDDGYGTAYDDQGYESYDNNYSNQSTSAELPSVSETCKRASSQESLSDATAVRYQSSAKVKEAGGGESVSNFISREKPSDKESLTKTYHADVPASPVIRPFVSLVLQKFTLPLFFSPFSTDLKNHTHMSFLTSTQCQTKSLKTVVQFHKGFPLAKPRTFKNFTAWTERGGAMS
ncbi:hypothetical protein INR49_023806 [Caranx melampygus]|nr:hypothetical protein INR49_023806 [Caranx melampygus]